MKLKDLKNLLDSATENAEISIENGKIVITEPQPIEYEFKVGDKVKVVHHNDGLAYEVVEQCLCDGEPAYYIKHNDLVELCYERFLNPFPEDITERIKTLANAVEWCRANGKDELVDAWYNNDFDGDEKDIDAYLKLRIITCALNEGWEPTMGKLDDRYFPIFKLDANWSESTKLELVYVGESSKLCFKSKELAKYAATQFKDIYLDFCGCKKNDNQ